MRIPIVAPVVLSTVAMCISAATLSAQSVADAVSASLLDRFEVVSGNLLAAAEQIPEEHYDYRPADEVRTFAEQFNHVAAAHLAYCGAVLGESAPPGSMGNPGTKAEIVERFRISREFCLEAYRRPWGEALAETVPVLGDSDTRAGILIQNTAHDNSHYGNIVTYMRTLGLVPPSSQPD
jgi:uncharacterized damage-inducible protein DinB